MKTVFLVTFFTATAAFQPHLVWRCSKLNRKSAENKEPSSAVASTGLIDTLRSFVSKKADAIADFQVRAFNDSNNRVAFRSALEKVMSGDMGKRDFLKSRVYRLARKINPGTDCNSEDECLVEVGSADPFLVEMAERGEF